MADIKEMATSKGLCPYALEAQLAKNTELVIMSYKYVLDPDLFNRLSLASDMYNSIMIFDEAHNIISIAKDESSIKVDPNLKHITRKRLDYVKEILTRRNMLWKAKKSV